jgi:hypothetical protein
MACGDAACQSNVTQCKCLTARSKAMEPGRSSISFRCRRYPVETSRQQPYAVYVQYGVAPDNPAAATPHLHDAQANT